MGSISSALLSKQGPRPMALGAKMNSLPAHLPAGDMSQIQIPSPAGPGPGTVNAPSHLRQPGTVFKEYIEISSSPSPSPSIEDDEPPERVPPQRTGFCLPHLSGLQSLLSREPSSPSARGPGASRVVRPAAPVPAHSINPTLLQPDINMDGDEMNFDNFDAFDPLDIRDAAVAQIMEEEFLAQMVARGRNDNEPLPPNQQGIYLAPGVANTKEEAIDKVLAVFPDMYSGHVHNLYDKISPDPDRIIAHILEDMDSGKSYPKAKDAENLRKRKRELDQDEEAALKYSAADRGAKMGLAIQRFVRTILSVEFPDTPMAFIDACLRRSKHSLFSAYRVLEEAERTYDTEDPPYNKIKAKRKMPNEYREHNLVASIGSMSHDPERVDVLRELEAARRIRRNADSKREEERMLQLAEEANLLKAKAEGTMLDCQCCFVDHPMNRMVHCDNEKDLHWFCRDCAKRNAETVIGLSKYELVCMAMEGCTSSFSMAQRSLFLDDKTVIALERNEQESNLRLAGIENLTSCPFCPYAAEYPPVEIDKEFRCEAPECEKVSCRLCKLESHIPKSCQEHAKEVGLSIRRQVEEAMSEALIRKCNKCRTPFVKEDGCNKMTCTRPGCGNVQCYVCSQSCTYSHFNDARRGGKAGNCPLFEKTAQRHEDEVNRAEKEALGKIRAEHPEFTEEDLTVKVSQAVLEDERQRRKHEVHPQQVAAPVFPGNANLVEYIAGFPHVQNMANEVLQNGFVDPRNQLQGPHAGNVQNMANNAMQNGFVDPRNVLQGPRAGEAALNRPGIGNFLNMIMPNGLDQMHPVLHRRHHARLGPVKVPNGVPDMLFPQGPPPAAPRGHVLQPVKERPEPLMYQPPAPHQPLDGGMARTRQPFEAHFKNLLDAEQGNLKYLAQPAKPQADGGLQDFDDFDGFDDFDDLDDDDFDLKAHLQANQFLEPPAPRRQSRVAGRLQGFARLRNVEQARKR